jgi:hypothetical protein
MRFTSRRSDHPPSFVDHIALNRTGASEPACSQYLCYVWQDHSDSAATPRGVMVKVFGTSHRLQGAVNGRMNVDDPSYSDLLTMLFREEKPDFVFEEAAGLGPTTASRKADGELGRGKYST